MKVAIQGVKASFHDVAARKYFKNQQVEPIECASFPILGKTLKDGASEYAMMAIENTIAGSILPNYSLLEKYGFKILGETYLRIEMCLLALPGQKLSGIRSVQSHPMALLQCTDFLGKLSDIKVIEASDTAESALEIQKRGLKNHAAIASKLAAETYGLEILAENIETDRSNYTRFLTLCRSEDVIANARANKASIRFETPDTPGTLVKALEVFQRHAVNMTKIQSIPILGKPYQYGFHCDLEWENPDAYRYAMKEFGAHSINLLQFGEYERGEKPVL